MELLEVVGQRFGEAVFRCLSNKNIKSTTKYSGKCHLHAGARIGFDLMLFLNDRTASAAQRNKASVARFISLQIVTRGREVISTHFNKKPYILLVLRSNLFAEFRSPATKVAQFAHAGSYATGTITSTCELFLQIAIGAWVAQARENTSATSQCADVK